MVGSGAFVREEGVPYASPRAIVLKCLCLGFACVLLLFFDLAFRK